MLRSIGLAAVVALLATACGGGSSAGVATLEGGSSPGDTVAGAAGADPASVEEALLAFAQCMRDAGVDIGDPTVDADGNVRLPRPDGDGEAPPDPAVRELRREAFAQCGSLIDGVVQGFRDRDQTEIQDRLLEFAACMRDNGYDMPDPDFSDAGPGPGGPFAGIDPDDPDFAAAREACGDILAGFRGPGGGAPRGGQNDG